MKQWTVAQGQPVRLPRGNRKVGEDPVEGWVMYRNDSKRLFFKITNILGGYKVEQWAFHELDLEGSGCRTC